MGTLEDSQTALAFPAAGNRCYRVQPCQPISLAHQSSTCLGKTYRQCAVFRSAETRPPVDPRPADDAGLPDAVVANAKRTAKTVVAVSHKTNAAAHRAREKLPVSAESLTPLVGLRRTGTKLLLMVTGVLLAGVLLLSSQLGGLFASSEPIAPREVVPLPTPTLAPTATPLPVSAEVDPDAPVCDPPYGWQPYDVETPQTLEALAQQTGTTLDALKQANCLDVAILTPGQRIYLPNSAER